MHDEADVFSDLKRSTKVEPDLLDVADMLVERKMGRFDPAKFDDRYEEALKAIVADKARVRKPKRSAPVKATDARGLMEALRASLGEGGKSPAKPKRPSKRAAAKAARGTQSARRAKG